MNLLFRPKHNTLAQITLFVVAAGAVGVPAGLMLYARTPYARQMQEPIEQPLQFDHRHPEKNLRPVSEVTNMDWKPEGDQAETGQRLLVENDVHTRTSCTTCHR